jgi:hypothetical protein
MDRGEMGKRRKGKKDHFPIYPFTHLPVSSRGDAVPPAFTMPPGTAGAKLLRNHNPRKITQTVMQLTQYQVGKSIGP